MYAELVRSCERLESVSPSQVKEATAEDGLDRPQVKFSVRVCVCVGGGGGGGGGRSG